MSFIRLYIQQEIEKERRLQEKIAKTVYTREKPSEIFQKDSAAQKEAEKYGESS